MKEIVNHIRSSWYKYLLEIIVITFGILLAFGLNNWKESWKRNRVEVTILKRLYEV